MKILVTGGAGFIGSHLVDGLIEKGNEVHVIDNLSSGKKEHVSERAVFHQIDLGEYDKIFDILKDNNFDVVYHLAAQMNIRKSVSDPVFDAKENIIDTLNLLEACVKGKVKHFVFSSSGGAVYGETYVPTSEEELEKPISLYGCAKLSIEKYLHYYGEVHGLKHTILRFANVYGPRQNPHGEAGVVAIFLDKMIKEENPVIYGGNQTRDFIYVGDVVNACLMALEEKESEVYNVGFGNEVSINELFDKINRLFSDKFAPKYEEKKSGEQERSCLDCKKAHEDLGWKTEVSFSVGLQKTLDWHMNLSGLKNNFESVIK